MGKLSGILLIIAGLINAVFGVFHLCFWDFFDWNKTLACLDAMNRGIMYTFNVCTAFFLFGMAITSIFFRKELMGTKLGKAMLIGFSSFWLLRAILEIVYFDISAPNSIGLFITCVFISVLYAIPVFKPLDK